MTTEELIAALREPVMYHSSAEQTNAQRRLAADRLEALTAPVEGMTLETTAILDRLQKAEEFLVGDYGYDQGTVCADARAFIDRLSSALAAERDRNERLAGALRSRDDEWQSAVQKLCVDIRVEDMSLTEIAKRIIGIRTALSQEKQP